MTQKQQLERLGAVAALMLDVRLAALKTAAKAKTDSEVQLQGLAVEPDNSGDISRIAAERAALAYQRWADARRAELNLTLARQTVTWIEARDAAREAFGKKQVIVGLAAGLRDK